MAMEKFVVLGGKRSREVEKALEDIERKVKERAPRATTTEVTKEEVKGYDVESEEPEAAPATQDIPPADVAPIAKDAKPVLPDVVRVSPAADADVIQDISEEYRSAFLSLNQRSALRSSGMSLPVRGYPRHSMIPIQRLFSLSDSTAMITGPAAPATSPASSPNVSAPASPETFLRSTSHD
ncbi:hypothetical protein BC826DRAFT_129587 [Russula brevipes]|nr:hypothetical protein BC826DRAFT_129587 [Russula brevipes]